MRRLALFPMMAVFFFCLAGSVQAQTVDVTGTWELTYATARGDRTMTVTFNQDGTTVTGTVQQQMMGGRGGGGGGNPATPPEIEIKDGKIDGNTLTFSYAMGMGDRSFEQSFTAEVTGDTMKGTMTGGMRQNATF